VNSLIRNSVLLTYHPIIQRAKASLSGRR